MIGIDFGTTTSEVAVYRPDGVAILADAHGDRVVPSVVAFPPYGPPVFGSKALARCALNPRNTLCSVKRLLGLTWFDKEVAEFRDSYGQYELTRGENDLPAFRTRAGLVTAADAATRLLGWLARCEHLPQDAAVAITAPVSFDETQRAALTRAVSAAGFAEARILLEPHAAALPYLSRGGRPQAVAVYDLGGGTFDFAVLRVHGLDHEVLAAGGEPYLGGDDLDRLLAEWVVEEVLRVHRWDLSTRPEAMARLVLACQQAKLRLSKIDRTRLPLSTLDPALSGKAIDLPRSALEAASRQLLQQTFLVCDQVLGEAGLRAAEVDAVILAGGTCYLPFVRQAVSLYFQRKPRCEVPPDRVVAMGAAIAAAARSGRATTVA